MSDLIQASFDYGILPAETAVIARSAAERIKLRLKRTVEDIIEIGRELTTVKAELPHGQFLPWIADNGMTLFNATNFQGKQYPCEILADNDILQDGYHVYCLSDARNGNVVYVGKTNRLRLRARQHCMVRFGNRLDQVKADIFYAGYPVILAPVFRCQDAQQADEIEQIVFELNKTTALNVQRNKWITNRRYQ